MTYIASIRTATIALATLFTTAAFAQDIRIGFHVPQTGFAAADGKSALHGAELAVEQINAKGGVLGRKLALVVYDDQAKADQAQPIANRLLGDGVKIVISGSYSAPDARRGGNFPASENPVHLRLRHSSRHHTCRRLRLPHFLHG